MPDIGKMLWPKSVAVVGASSDVQGLRGRILEIILSHPFAGKVYPVSRSATEVQGLKAYPSVEALPEPADLAILIIPAQYMPAELERCGRAGIKAAVILSSGFAEEGETGMRMQSEIAAIARRYDMAVSGPNTEGFANIAGAFCPTFSPAMDKNAGPIKPTRALGERPGVGDFAEWRPRLCLFRPRPPAQPCLPPHRHHRQRSRARSLRLSSTTCSTKVRPTSSCCCWRT